MVFGDFGERHYHTHCTQHRWMLSKMNDPLTTVLVRHQGQPFIAGVTQWWKIYDRVGLGHWNVTETAFQLPIVVSEWSPQTLGLNPHQSIFRYQIQTDGRTGVWCTKDLINKEARWEKYKFLYTVFSRNIAYYISVITKTTSTRFPHKEGQSEKPSPDRNLTFYRYPRLWEYNVIVERGIVSGQS